MGKLVKIKEEGSWKQVENVDTLWESIAEYIQRSTKEILETSRGGGSRVNRAWS